MKIVEKILKEIILNKFPRAEGQSILGLKGMTEGLAKLTVTGLHQGTSSWNFKLQGHRKFPQAGKMPNVKCARCLHSNTIVKRQNSEGKYFQYFHLKTNKTGKLSQKAFLGRKACIKMRVKKRENRRLRTRIKVNLEYLMDENALRGNSHIITEFGSK